MKKGQLLKKKKIEKIGINKMKIINEDKIVGSENNNIIDKNKNENEYKRIKKNIL